MALPYSHLWLALPVVACRAPVPPPITLVTALGSPDRSRHRRGRLGRCGRRPLGLRPERVGDPLYARSSLRYPRGRPPHRRAPIAGPGLLCARPTAGGRHIEPVHAFTFPCTGPGADNRPV